MFVSQFQQPRGLWLSTSLLRFPKHRTKQFKFRLREPLIPIPRISFSFQTAPRDIKIPCSCRLCPSSLTSSPHQPNPGPRIPKNGNHGILRAISTEAGIPVAVLVVAPTPTLPVCRCANPGRLVLRSIQNVVPYRSTSANHQNTLENRGTDRQTRPYVDEEYSTE